MEGEQPTPEHQAPQIEPKIYVASLSDYNNGHLHGRWINAAQEAAAIQEENMNKQNMELGGTGNIRQRTSEVNNKKKFQKNKAIKISRHNGIEPEKKKKKCC